MRFAVVACVLAGSGGLHTGCSFHHGAFSSGSSDATIDDGAIANDGRGADGAPDACTRFSTHVDTCMPAVTPGGPLTLSGVNAYDTDTFMLTTPGGPVTVPHQTLVMPDGDEIAVILVSAFTLGDGATLRVTGPNDHRPLGIVAYGTVNIDGLVDLAGNGAGARTATSCGLQAGQSGESDTGGGGGGGGGAFAGDGGDGEDGDSDSNAGGDGTSNGGQNGQKIARPSHIRGGCPGGPGGDGSSNNTAGDGGNGGGAIFIAASGAITIGTNGSINAGGGGGRGGNNNGGGGGGAGSGGMIVLESSSISISGKLAANGGGGGEGADGSDGRNGDPGGLVTTRANGGDGLASEGGDGGDGGAGATPNGLDANNLKKGGGGGGGGGAGFIAVTGGNLSLNNPTISPQSALWP